MKMPVVNGIIFPPSLFMQKSGVLAAHIFSKTSWKKPQFNEKAIRLVLFVDSDVKGRRIAFDSKAVVTEEEKGGRWCRAQKLTSLKEGKIQPSTSNQKCKYSYEPQRTGSEGKMLEEMMFGAEGFAYKGTSLKVHVIRKPPQLMLTKVFITEKPKKSSLMDSEESSSFCSAPDLSIPRTTSVDNRDIRGISHSVPMDVPSPPRSWSIDLIDEDSGLASLTSSGSFQPYPSPGSTGSSCNSLNRRWQRGQTTTLEGSLRRRSIQDSLSTEVPASSTNRPRRHKMALGIIFGAMDDSSEEANRLFENFFFSHMALMEGHLEQLRTSVERAYYTKNFLSRMIEAFEHFRRDITDLYTAPRLSEPVWLNMMSFSSYKYMLCEKFIREFVGLATKFDGKNTNFFMSTLVTAVLTHHLAWVPTVMPAGGSPSNTYLDKHSAKWVDTLAKTHPYNPLWAQLGDLYGSIGFPLKLSRTVIVGKKADLVKRVLYILSYFIRCSDVLETSEFGSLEVYLNSLNFVETPGDSDKNLVPSTPTPVSSCAATPVTMPLFNSLPLESLLSEKTSYETSLVDSEKKDHNSNNKGPCSPHEGNKCEQCEMNRKSGDYTESNLGKSTLHLESSNAGICICDITSQLKECSKPDSTQSCNSKEGGGERVCSYIQKKKESLKLEIPDQESLHPTKGEQSVGAVDNSFKPCKLSTVDILGDAKCHNVQHVRKSSDIGRIEDLLNKDEDRIDSLKFDKGLGLPENVGKVLTKEEIKSIFQKKGSNSMFNEYFDTDEAEAKTIDDVDEKDRVVDLPSLKKQGGGERRVQIDEASHKTPSLPDLAHQPKVELLKSHRTRLGSLDQTYKQRRASMSRQISENAPGRCRPVTPTELGKRRHMSSTSSFDFDLYDPRAFCQELPMPGLGCEFSCTSQKDFDKNFGRSLLADYSDHYMSDFVLHGTSDKGHEDKLVRDLKMATQYSVLDETIAEAVYIVADTDAWTVKLYSSQHIDPMGSCAPQPCIASQLISNLTEAVVSMYKLKMSPEFCVMHLEDRLQEIYFKSKMLAEYLSQTKPQKNSIKELLSVLGFDRSDLPLLVAIAGTHTPNFPLVCLS